MTNNLNLLTTEQFFGSSDPSLDKDMVTLIDHYTGEIVNYQQIGGTVNNGVIYRVKAGVSYKRMITGDISVRICGAVGDGNTDDASKIQTLINEMEAGQVLNLENKRYMLGAPLQINKSIKIRGASTNGNRETFPAYILTNNVTAIEINTSGVILEGFSIGNAPAYFLQNTAIRVNGLNDPLTHIDNLTINNVFINGYETGLEINTVWSSQFQTLKTLNCKVGILVKGNSVNNEISNNTSLSIVDGFDIPDSKGIWFYGDTTKEGWRIIDTLIYGVYEGIYAEKTSHVNFMNSMIDFCRHIGIVLLDDCHNWNINSNYIALDQPGYGLYLSNNVENPLMIRGNKIIDNDILSYNTVADNEISIGINIVGTGSFYDDVRGNSVKNFKVYDIKANEGLKTTISNNKCLSDLEINIISNFITNDNLGTVYYQNLNDFFHLAKVKVTYADAYPVVSDPKWERGDIILNTVPSADGPIGWVNTTDGTNTWKPFGIITN